MTKYEPLTRHLALRHLSEIPMRFSDIEALLGFQLPPSSRKYRTWWSNNADSSVITKAWLNAGYRTRDVDLLAEKLVFVKLNTAWTKANTPADNAAPGTEDNARRIDQIEPAPGPASDGLTPKPRRRHPLFGKFQDTLWIDPTLDLTEPAYDGGDAWLDEKARKITEGMR